MSYSLLWLPSVLRKAGLVVEEMKGWETRGHEDVSKTLGVMIHHTAEKIDADQNPALQTITYGRKAAKATKTTKAVSALLGPLANLGLGQDGRYWMIAAGLAWHAGPGIWRGIKTGNSSFIGIEPENNGIGEAWPPFQIECLARGSAAIAKYKKFKVEMVCGHKEYALPPGRKIDPNFDMPNFRKMVEGFMK